MPSISLPAITFADVAAGASIVGTGISAIGAISGGNASAGMAAYNAQVARNNQTIAQQNADYAFKAGEARAGDQSLKARAQQGRTVAAIAASGLDVNSGSSVDVRESERELGQLDVERTRQQAALTAYGYRTTASNFGATAGLDEAEGKFASQAGYLKGFGSLLGGASNLGKFSWLTDSKATGDWSPRSDAVG